MKAILSSLFLILMTACAAVPTPYHYETLYPDTTHVEFKFLVVKEKDSKAVLQGSLFHKPISPTRESGHIDISVYSPQGALIVETTTHYQTPVGSYHAWAYTGVSFRALLDQLPPPGSVIKLAFHVTNQKSNAQELHGKNIAR